MRGAPVVCAALLAVALVPLVPTAVAAESTIRVLHVVEVDALLEETVTITVTYDTTRYSEKWTWTVPANAEGVSVRDEMGPVAVTEDPARPGHLSFTTHYGNCCRQGDRDFTITFERPALDPIAPPFYRGGQSTVGADNFDTRFLLKLAPTVKLARSSPSFAETSDGWERRTVQPEYLTYLLEGPAAAGIVDFTMGPWRFLAPQDVARDLHDLAEATLPDLEALEALTGIAPPYSRYLVAVEPGTEFSWEIGKAVGDGLILLNGDALRGSLEKGQPLAVRQGLLHETFHAATEKALAWTRGLDWWKEGTARHSEHLLEAGNGPEVAGCAIHERGSTCYVNSTRIAYDDLAAYYRRGTPFALRAWTPDAEQTAETRRFGYAYAGFVVGAYLDQHGEEAYRAVWKALAAVNGTQPSACASCDANLLEATLLKHAPGTTVDDLWFPFRELFDSDEAAFRARVAALVAPPLPSPPAGHGGSPDGEAEDGDPDVLIARPGRPSTIPAAPPLLAAGALLALAFLARRR